ncbi:MAG: substrate-binding domain-containing protein [Anaeroplasma sp.]|uniref:substrate-binding domain-containing protein n=1 Tax=Anaeroplasma sp. TaxID=1872523 RepID=UPI002A91F61E|nr:substrate-binding domain-containing protein [Anaeroplasma sp.]MDY5983396.1 substrate-binding domain-containing protein [Anaeroplasma sp.]
MKKILKFSCLLFVAFFGLVGCSNNAFNPEAEIKLYTRDTTSGTRDGFFTGIGLSEAKEDNSILKVEGLGTVESNGDMINSIKNDKYGIGYISMSSLEGSNLKGLSYEGVAPTEENVLNKSYTLTRNFNYIVRSNYDNAEKEQIIEAFLAYLTTQEAKSTMQSEGGILDVKASDPTWDSIKGNYPIVTLDHSDITIHFGGSTSVSKMAQALASEFSSLCGNVNFSHNYYGSGDAYKKTQGDDKDSTGYLDMAFASREFKLDSSEPAEDGTYGNLCIDAIVVVVNALNTCKDIHKDQLVKMYTGVYTKWNEVI